MTAAIPFLVVVILVLLLSHLSGRLGHEDNSDLHPQDGPRPVTPLQNVLQTAVHEESAQRPPREVKAEPVSGRAVLRNLYQTAHECCLGLGFLACTDNPDICQHCGAHRLNHGAPPGWLGLDGTYKMRRDV